MRVVLPAAVFLFASPTLAADGVAKRFVLSLGVGSGHVEELCDCYGGIAAGPAIPVGVGLELAGRWVAMELGARLLTVFDRERGTKGFAPSFLLAIRVTPGRAIIEAGTGAAYVAAIDHPRDGSDPGSGILLHAAIGMRATEHLRVLIPFDLMGSGAAVAFFYGGVLEIALPGQATR